MNHMNPKTVTGLGIAAVLALVAAVAITASRKPVDETTQAAAYVLPELRDHLNEIKTVTLTGAEDKPLVTLERDGNGWTLKERHGYPAEVAKLREWLLKLADATLLEQKTANEQRYAELGVGDLRDKDAKGVLVTLDGLGKPVRLIVGNLNTRGDGTFVRRAEDKQSWLAKGNLSVGKNVADWLEKVLVDIPSTRVKEVVLRRPDGKMLRVSKQQSGDANFKVADVPKGREVASEFIANGLGSTLAALTLEDVFPATEEDPSAHRKVHKARYATFDGLVVEIEAWRQGDKVYARLTGDLDKALAEAYIQSEQAREKADFEAKQKERAANNEQKTAEVKAVDDQTGTAKRDGPKTEEPPSLAISDPAKDRQQRLAALDKEAAGLKQRFAGWTFVLPLNKFSNIDKSLDDLLKPVEAKKVGVKKSPAH